MNTTTTPDTTTPDTTTPDTTTHDTTAGTVVPKPVALDLYRDIHKAIRNELFAVTSMAGALDPTDPAARRAHGERVHVLVDLLAHHAEHEDSNLDVVIARLDPQLATDITRAHAQIDARMRRLSDLADVVQSHPDARAATHELYLELAAFTADYVQHQDTEERVVMRLLDAHLGFEQLLQLHVQILASVQPDVMARCLALMLPAINIVDRTEMLGAMQATAPAEAFAATWAIAADVLTVREYLSTATRLGLAVDARVMDQA